MSIHKEIGKLEQKLAYNIGDLGDDFYNAHKSYRDYKSIQVQPYDDAEFVLANDKVSVWIYFGYNTDKVSVSIFETPYGIVKDFQHMDTDALQESRIDDKSLSVNPKTTVDDVWRWLKPILDHHA